MSERFTQLLAAYHARDQTLAMLCGLAALLVLPWIMFEVFPVLKKWRFAQPAVTAVIIVIYLVMVIRSI